MQTSEQITEIAPALVAVQSKIEDPEANATNPNLSSKYSTLTTVMRAIRPVLSEHGIAIIQSPSASVIDGQYRVGLVTRLLHTSGQWIQGETFTAPAETNRATTPVQMFKGAVTVMRRASALGMLGIAEDDDDGNAAGQPTQSGQVHSIGTAKATSGPGIVNAPAPATTAAQPAAVDEAAVLLELDSLAVDTVANAERIKAALADGPVAVEKLLRQELESAILGECSRLNADIGAFEASLAKRGAKAITDLTTDQMREAVAAMKAQPAPTEVVT